MKFEEYRGIKNLVVAELTETVNEKGETVAIIGSTGSGKSSLVNEILYKHSMERISIYEDEGFDVKYLN